MTLDETLRNLESVGTASNRKLYESLGARTPLYGAGLLELKRLRKAIGTDHELALALWQTDIPDARHLAVMIADPRQATKKLLNRWVAEINYYFLTDLFARDLASHAPSADDCIEKWTASPKEWIGRTGWMTLALLLSRKEKLAEDQLVYYLQQIETQIHHSPNRVRDAMLHALIGIGRRSPALRKMAVAAAGNIGPVDVEFGNVRGKIPNVLAHLQPT